jgi:MFS transporter, AAHS family, benzoate transport protein
MFWTTCFMCLFMVYALSAWLAALMAGAGHGLGSALAFVFALNLGGVAGAIGGGLLADRFSIKHVLVGMYVVAGIAIVMLGYPLPRPILFGVVALAGAATIGSQIVTTAYAGQFYAPAMRTIGVGWALGVGRVGAIAAPILIGALVGLALPFRLNFVAIAIPAAAAAVAIALIDSRGAARRHGKTAAGAA